jgi:YVTN family beta-propeller protein
MFAGSGALAGIWSESSTVGIASNRVVLPNSQTLTPAGTTTELPGTRPVAIAISPNRKLLITAGKTSRLIVMNLPGPENPRHIPLPGKTMKAETGKTNNIKPDHKGQISYTGLVFSPDGSRIYMSNVNGSIKVFRVDGTYIVLLADWALPGGASPKRNAEIPVGLAVSPDGKRLYVCGSLSNKLYELDTSTGNILRTLQVGMVPFQVVVRDGFLYVCNRAGSPPKSGDKTELAGQGTRLPVEGPLALVHKGTVSIIDLNSGKTVASIGVGRQPGAIEFSPDGKFLVVANADSDSLSVIDLKERKLAGEYSVRWKADDPFGASPTALCFISKTKLAVCLGTQNALGIFSFNKHGETKLTGMIPTAWFPSGVVYDSRNKMLHVSNMKGFGSGAQLIREGQKARSRAYFGTLSHIPYPGRRELKKLTKQTLDNYRIDMVRRALLPARPGMTPVPIPERVGEPSVFKHVIYIIRENRTYDQVYGDISNGNGDTNLCVFGKNITPNLHKVANDFVLLDNTYCSSILSADGHNWSLSAFANDYLERSFAGFPRSYPDGLSGNDFDVLAWSPQGFLWSAANKVGRSVRVYGEMCGSKTMFRDSSRKASPSFMDFYNDYRNGTSNCYFTTFAGHSSVKPFLDTNYPGWSMKIPDQVRADIFINHLKECERGEAQFENLHIMSVHNNHTSGTRPGTPTPGAAVADNDLAVGRIIEAVSHSSFWSNTCIFSIEDDPQAGWDHVSGYRTDCQVVSPYTKRGVVISDHFNQPGLLRTIELILGIPPLNQMDAASTPMRTCFTNTPDFTPYNAVANHIQLDTINPSRAEIKSRKMRRYARKSEKMPFERCDACDEDTLNHIIWYAMNGPASQYPSWAITPGLDDDDD